MNKEELDQLFVKYLEGKCSPEEIRQVEGLIDAYDNHNETWEQLSKPAQETWLRGLFTAIQNSISSQNNKAFQRRNPFSFHRITAAAAILLVAGAGIWFYDTYKTAPGVASDTGNITLSQDLPPGKQGATLTLANGKSIKLNEAENGELIKEAGISILKSADGQLIYQVSGSPPKGGAAITNTLSTAKGETYRLRLPDSSLVYLNAASSLTYPAVLLRNGKRIVRLQGEGYFEIAKDKKHPFIVESKGQQVEVLGTHFNISSYAGESHTKTTLLEGAVKILSLSSKAVVLKPNQQAMLGGDEFITKEVNVAEAVDWVNAKFICDNMALGELLDKVARWYDVEFAYADSTVLQEKVTGTLSRTANISKLLNRIALTGEVKFDIRGRTITVLKR